MTASYDAIVVGLGAMGSATLSHLAARGGNVLGIERFGPAHTFGSSHGESRIIRELYFEDPLFVPIVRRSYDLWRELERSTGRDLMRITGGLSMGPSSGTIVTGAQLSAQVHGIQHEVLSATELRRRFPAFQIPRDHVAVWDARAGYLDPEACVTAHLDQARRSGATLLFEEPVLSWEADGAGVRVHTARGSYYAGQLVISAGAWARSLMKLDRVPLQVERQVVTWFEPVDHAEWYAPDAFPIYISEDAGGRMIYGFPKLAKGVKAAIYHDGEVVDDADLVRRQVSDRDVREVRDAVRECLPGIAAGTVLASTVCLFTNTPDEYFVIDFHPEYPQVLISSPCSGHGFKFASAIGELQADMLTGEPTRFDVTPFSVARFQ